MQKMHSISNKNKINFNNHNMKVKKIYHIVTEDDVAKPKPRYKPPSLPPIARRLQNYCDCPQCNPYHYCNCAHCTGEYECPYYPRQQHPYYEVESKPIAQMRSAYRTPIPQSPSRLVYC